MILIEESPYMFPVSYFSCLVMILWIMLDAGVYATSFTETGQTEMLIISNLARAEILLTVSKISVT